MPSSVDGERLKHVGFSLLYWDDALGIACKPQAAEDGVSRCLPEAPGTMYFTDAECTQPVLVAGAGSCGEAPPYFAYSTGTDAAGCGDGLVRVVKRGSAVDPPAKIYLGGGGSCELTGAFNHPTPSGPFYEALPTEPSAWVGMTEEVTPVTDRLGVAHWVGADGARFEAGAVLWPSKAPCDAWPTAASEAPLHCVPTERARAEDGLFSESACTRPVASSCSAAAVLDLSGIQGKPTPSFFRLGDAAASVWMPSLVDGTCAAVPPTWLPAKHYYEVGDLVPMDDFPLLSTLVEGTERIRKQYRASEGKKLFLLSLYDADYELPCEALTFTDGSTRCVSSYFVAFDGVRAFQDARCTVPLRLFGGSVGWPNPRWALSQAPQSSQCGPAKYSVNEAVPRTQIWYEIGDKGACAVGVPDPHSAAYELGAVRDPAELFAVVDPGSL